MNMKKVITLVLAMALLVTVAVAGTVAWLMDTTGTVENTFTTTNVDITLKETTGASYDMVPGSTIDKDPKVAVVAGSEDCWLFVKVIKGNNVDNYLDYSIADGWTALDGEEGVYYREAKAGDSFSVLANDRVVVKTTVTNEMMATAATTQPKLTFQAYAVQKANVATVADAWGYAQSAAIYGTT